MTVMRTQSIGRRPARRAHRIAAVVLLVLTTGAMAPRASGGDRPANVSSPPMVEPVTLDWKAMATLNYRTGEMPESLKKLDGVVVRVPGFMVPLEDTETRVTEFLLVPYFGACIHVPPPPPNQMAHVLMKKGQQVEVNLWDPIWIIGTLNIENVESPYGMVGYQLTGERIEPYEG